MALLVILQQAAQHGATAHATAPGDAGAEEPAPADWLPDLAAQLAQQVCVWGGYASVGRGVRICGPGCTQQWAGVYSAAGCGLLSLHWITCLPTHHASPRAPALRLVAPFCATPYSFLPFLPPPPHLP